MRQATVVFLLVLHIGLAGAAQAWPSSATDNDNSCREGCHSDVQTGLMTVTGADTVLDLGVQLDGKMRGPLKTFLADPGSTVTLSMEVLHPMGMFAVQLKRLEEPGQQNDLNNFLIWMEDNDPANVWTRHENGNPPYFTNDDGHDGGHPAHEAGIFSFHLFIDPDTPSDVYDLEFAVAGATCCDLWYQDEHFYVHVPEPGLQLLHGVALVLIAVLGRRASARPPHGLARAVQGGVRDEQLRLGSPGPV